MPTLSGQSNNYPFLYQGMDHEFLEPDQFYYSGDGQFYSAQCWEMAVNRGLTNASRAYCPGGGGVGIICEEWLCRTPFGSNFSISLFCT